MGLSTAPQLRFLKRQGRGAKSTAADVLQDTPAQPAAGVRNFAMFVGEHKCDLETAAQRPAVLSSTEQQQQLTMDNGMLWRS